jgi:hypothetical protein
MELINKITIDMVRKGAAPILYAVQGESYTRVIEAKLFQNGYPVNTENTAISFAYKKPDGTSGWYDTLPNGESAATKIDGGVSVKLAPQVLTVAGIVDCVIRLETIDGSARATTFNLSIDVAEDPAANKLESDNYYSVQNWDDVNNKFSEIEKDIERIESQGGGGGGGIGVNGTTFYPNVSADGVISWTNDGGKENPEPVNLVTAVISALPVYNGEVVE